MQAMYIACFICVVYTCGQLTVVHGTDAVSNSTATTHSAEKSSLNLKTYKSLSRNQSDGIVTLEIQVDSDDSAGVQQSIPSVIVMILNEAATPTSATTIKTNATEVDTQKNGSDNSSTAGHRYRRSEAIGSYTQDGIIVVRIEPAVRDGKLVVPLIAENTEGEVLKDELLKDKLQANKKIISDNLGYTVMSIYVGMPEPRRVSVIEVHRNLFIGVLILVAVAILILIVCFLCFYCCRKRKSAQLNTGYKEEPIKKTYCEEEMVELTPVVPLHSAPPPQHQPTDDGNRSSNEPTADDEKGWIVPLDQLSPEELDQPADVPISKL